MSRPDTARQMRSLLHGKIDSSWNRDRLASQSGMECGHECDGGDRRAANAGYVLPGILLHYDQDRACWRRQRANILLRPKGEGIGASLLPYRPRRCVGGQREAMPSSIRRPSQPTSTVCASAAEALGGPHKFTDRDSRFLTELGGECERRCACPRFDPGNGRLADAQNLLGLKLRDSALLPPSPQRVCHFHCRRLP